MKPSRFVWLLVGVLTAPAFAVSAERTPHPMTLEEALSRALSKNYAIAVERESFATAVQGVLREEAAHDFALGWDAGFERRTGPVSSLFSDAPLGAVAPRLRSVDVEASLSRLLPTGGSVSLLASGGRASAGGTFSPLSPSYATAIGLEIRQPLLRDRAIDPVRRRIRVARSERDHSLATLRRTVTDTLAAVDTAYWSLTAAQREVEVRQGAVSLARQQLEETRARVAAGTLPGNDTAQPRAELERRKGEMLAAQEQAVRAENALKGLILDEGADPLWSKHLVPSDPAETAAAALEITAALVAAEQGRPEIDEAKAALASRSIELRAARDETKPRLDAVAAYTRRDRADLLNGNALAGGLYPDFRVGLSLSMPVGNRAARARAAIGEAEERRAAAVLAGVRQAVRVEVANAAAAVETTAERTFVAGAAREAAEVQLRSEQDRFTAGISTNFLVLTRQNDLSRARLDEIQALSDHHKALTELQRASGRLLEERHVVVTEDAPIPGASGGPK